MKDWISIARSSFPGSGGNLIKGYETIPYNLIVFCCKNFTSNRDAKQTYRWGLCKLEKILDDQHPDKWVRIYIKKCNEKDKYEIDHALELLNRIKQKKILPLGCVDHFRYFKKFRKDVINLMCNAGLTVKCLSAMTTYYPSCIIRDVLCNVAANTIQRIWKEKRRYKAVIVIQSCWKGYWHRKYIWFNPYSIIGAKRLESLAKLHTSGDAK